MLVTVAVFLALFCALGVFDGWYFHLYKFKLHLVPAARKEHLIHTLRAFVFVPLSLLLFVLNSAGWLLSLALLLVVADLVLELIDVLEERKSRAPLGGTPAEETAIHIFASCFKFTAIVILFLTKPLEAYSWNSEILLADSLPVYLMVIGMGFAVGCLMGGVHSLILMIPAGGASKVCRRPAWPRGLCPYMMSLALVVIPSVWALSGSFCGSCP